MALLEEVCHWEGLEFFKRPGKAQWFSLPWPGNQDVELPAISPAPCLPMCHHTPHHNDNRLNF